MRLYLPMQPEYVLSVGDFESLDFSGHWLWSWLVSSLDNSCLLSTGSHLQMGFFFGGGGGGEGGGFFCLSLFLLLLICGLVGTDPNTLKNKG